MLINDDNKSELIDAYLDGRMSTEDVAAFAIELKNDADLRVEVQAQKAVRKSMVLQGRKEMKLKLKAFHAEMQEENNSENANKEAIMRSIGVGGKTEEKVKPVIFSYRSKTMYAIAAAVVVLMVSSIAFFAYREQKQDALAKQGKVYKIEMKDLGQVAMSFAGKESPVSTSLVLFLKGDDKYNFHYQFTDTLTIFSKYLDPANANIYVEHDAGKKTYLLIIDGKRYPLERGFIDINPLKQEDELRK
ncbi:MAG: hypothetical protein EAZ08_09920 [Cytophagales bacterium]|nr:MAG: hypothetical protein EAZ08_09920 [Cytophagales bacterium]